MMFRNVRLLIWKLISCLFWHLSKVMLMLHMSEHLWILALIALNSWPRVRMRMLAFVHIRLLNSFLCLIHNFAIALYIENYLPLLLLLQVTLVLRSLWVILLGKLRHVSRTSHIQSWSYWLGCKVML